MSRESSPIKMDCDAVYFDPRFGRHGRPIRHCTFSDESDSSDYEPGSEATEVMIRSFETAQRKLKEKKLQAEMEAKKEEKENKEAEKKSGKLQKRRAVATDKKGKKSTSSAAAVAKPSGPKAKSRVMKAKQ